MMTHGPETQKNSSAEILKGILRDSSSPKKNIKVHFSDNEEDTVNVEIKEFDIDEEDLKKYPARVNKKGPAHNTNLDWNSDSNAAKKTLDFYKRIVVRHFNKRGALYKSHIDLWNYELDKSEAPGFYKKSSHPEIDDAKKITMAHALIARYYKDRYQKELEKRLTPQPSSSKGVWQFLFGASTRIGNLKFDSYDEAIMPEIIAAIKKKGKENQFPIYYEDVIFEAELQLNEKKFRKKLRVYCAENNVTEWTQKCIEEEPTLQEYIKRDPLTSRKIIWDVATKVLISQHLRDFLEKKPEYLFSTLTDWMKVRDSELLPQILSAIDIDKKDAKTIKEVTFVLGMELVSLRALCASMVDSQTRQLKRNLILNKKTKIEQEEWKKNLPEPISSDKTYEFIGKAVVEQIKIERRLVKDAAIKYFNAQASSWFGYRNIFNMKNDASAVNYAVSSLKNNNLSLAITKVEQHNKAIEEAFKEAKINFSNTPKVSWFTSLIKWFTGDITTVAQPVLSSSEDEHDNGLMFNMNVNISAYEAVPTIPKSEELAVVAVPIIESTTNTTLTQERKNMIRHSFSIWAKNSSQKMSEPNQVQDNDVRHGI